MRYGSIQVNDGLAMIREKITYRLYAVKRMFERKISEKEVRYALETGEVIEDYPDDTPYPSRLILSCYRGRPIHVVAANNAGRGFNEMRYLQKSIH